MAIAVVTVEAKVWFDMRGLRLLWDEEVSRTIVGCPGSDSCRDVAGGVMIYLRRGSATRNDVARRLHRLGRITPSGTIRFKVPHLAGGRYHLVGRVRIGNSRRLMPVSGTFRIAQPGRASGTPT